MAFRTIHTKYGLQLMTQAEASGVLITLDFFEIVTER